MANIKGSKDRLTYAPNYSTSFPYTHHVEFEETSSSQHSNSSTISVTASLTSSGASFDSQAAANSLSVYWYDNNGHSDGTRVKLNDEIWSLGTNGTISVSGTISVAHKSDGTLKGRAESYWTKKDGNNYTPATSSVATDNTDLTNIIRGSSISIPESRVVVDGIKTITIRLNRPNSSYTDTLTYKLGSATGTIATKTSETSISWVVPTSILNGIPNAKSGTATIYCQSYNGDTAMGSSSATVVIATSQELHGPTLSITSAVDNNAGVQYGSRTLGQIEGDSFISGMSEVQLTIAAEGRYGASRKRTETTLNGNTIGGTLTPVFSGDLGNGVFTIMTRDTRGYETTLNYTIDVVDYFPPSIVKAIADRDSTTTTTVVGSTVGAWCSGSLGGMSNTLTVTVRYSNPSATPATGTKTINAVKQGNTWTYDGALITDLANSSAGTIQYVFSDVFNTVESAVINIYEYLPVFAMFQNHFDVFGELHIHDRANPNLFSVLPYNYHEALFQYHAGDIVSFADNIAAFPGFVTSGGGVLVFSIPLPKAAASGVVASVSGSVIVRHADGSYISNGGNNDGQPVALSNLGTVTADCDANYVRVRVQLATATTLTNNSVICVTPGTALSITFSASST